MFRTSHSFTHLPNVYKPPTLPLAQALGGIVATKTGRVVATWSLYSREGTDINKEKNNNVTLGDDTWQGV